MAHNALWGYPMINLLSLDGTHEELRTVDLRRRVLNYYGSINPARFLSSTKNEVLNHFTRAELPDLLTEYQKLYASGVDMKRYD